MDIFFHSPSSFLSLYLFPLALILHSFLYDLYFCLAIGTYGPYRPYLTLLMAQKSKESSDLWSRHINIHCYLFPQSLL